jgi:glycosyltransferase involved in cell wall biosynthesis
MMDIIENINYSQFEVSVAYKPECPQFELDLLVDLKNLGIKLVPLRGKRLFSFLGIFDLYRHLKKDCVQIVHCWDALGIAARILRLFSDCHVIESFCNPVISKGSFIYYWVNKITSLLLNGIIFCTTGVQKSYKQNKTIFLSRKKIALIANCINTGTITERVYDRKKIRKKWKITQEEVILTNIGYFNDQKGQIYLLEAMELILLEIPQIKLILVGWGPLKATLRRKAQDLGIEKNVVFAGKCPHDTVFEILSITDLFVLSSLWEGFGLVLGEAMAMGKPVVCTRTVGSQVVVRHNETGLIVPPQNPQALTEAVIDLLNNPDRMKKMGELGRKRVTALFSPERFVQKHEAFYREIIQ